MPKPRPIRVRVVADLSQFAQGLREAADAIDNLNEPACAHVWSRQVFELPDWICTLCGAEWDGGRA